MPVRCLQSVTAELPLCMCVRVGSHISEISVKLSLCLRHVMTWILFSLRHPCPPLPLCKSIQLCGFYFHLFSFFTLLRVSMFELSHTENCDITPFPPLPHVAVKPYTAPLFRHMKSSVWEPLWRATSLHFKTNGQLRGKTEYSMCFLGSAGNAEDSGLQLSQQNNQMCFEA